MRTEAPAMRASDADTAVLSGVGAGTDLVRTKLVPPVAGGRMVSRPRLEGGLSIDGHTRLVLIDAPAGYGKTTVAASWLRQAGREGAATAWVSLSGPENDPVLFWRYVVAALRDGDASVGERADALLAVPGVGLETVVVSLVNDLARRDRETLLLLDDYHVIREPSVHGLMRSFLELAPPCARVVVVTRRDPPLGLGSLRASGQLVEIRGEDLRLTIEEAAAFLRDGAGIELADSEIRTMVGRTEGWAAALQLAALWLRGEPDRSAAIREFAGDNRHIVDYLAEQVLAGLDPDVERFLLHTSILGRMSAPLCEAVTNEPGAAESLRAVERANLFLVGLDGRRWWYRYHHLFAEQLRAELSRREPGLVPVLHTRAAAWHRDHGTVGEAIHHAMQAGDFTAAADSIMRSWLRLVRTGRSLTVLRWLERIPQDALSAFPESGYIGAIAAGGLGASEAAIERWVRISAPAAQTEVPLGDRLLDGTTSVRANLDFVHVHFLYRDIGKAAATAQRVADEQPPGGPGRVVALASLGWLRYLEGDPGAAGIATAEALADRDAPARPHGLIYALATHALLALDAGDPARADRTARRGLEVAESLGLSDSQSAALGHVAAGRALLETGQAARGAEEIQLGVAQLHGRAPVANHIYALLTLAEARHASGDLVAANRASDEAAGLLDSFTDAGILTGLLGAARQRATLGRRRRPAQPGGTLTESELSVLRIMGSKSRAAIAAELAVSPNTIKTHIASIYRKLEVASREDAVTRARALDLL